MASATLTGQMGAMVLIEACVTSKWWLGASKSTNGAEVARRIRDYYTAKGIAVNEALVAEDVSGLQPQACSKRRRLGRCRPSWRGSASPWSLVEPAAVRRHHDCGWRAHQRRPFRLRPHRKRPMSRPRSIRPSFWRVTFVASLRGCASNSIPSSGHQRSYPLPAEC